MIFRCSFCFKKEKTHNSGRSDTFDHACPQFYPGVYVALVTLLTYPVSACAAERSFSGMKRLKTPLRSTMSKERLSSLAIHFDFPHTQAQEC